MKTKKVTLALYKYIKFGTEIVMESSDHDPEDCFRISEYRDVEFDVIDTASQNDALKAIKIKEAQDRLDVAQKELDELLGVK